MTVCSLAVAGFVFEVHTAFPDTMEQCRDYLTEREADAVLSVGEADIALEREILARVAEAEHTEIPYFTVGQLEISAVHRKVADYLSYHNTVMFHAVLVDRGGEGYLFTAPSGTGKSTHAENWVKQFPDCTIINGDKPMLMLQGDRFVGCGTPWAGKEGKQCNRAVPIKAMVLLSRARENQIRRVPFEAVFPRVMQQCYYPGDGEGMLRIADLVGQMSGRMAFYELACSVAQESAQVAYDGMQSPTGDPEQA